MSTLNLFLDFTSVPGIASYRVKYKLTTDTAWTTVSPEPTTTPVEITGIDGTKAYNVSIEANCGNGNYSTPVVVTANPPSTSTSSGQSTLTMSGISVKGSVEITGINGDPTDILWSITPSTTSFPALSGTYNLRVITHSVTDTTPVACDVVVNGIISPSTGDVTINNVIFPFTMVIEPPTA